MAVRLPPAALTLATEESVMRVLSTRSLLRTASMCRALALPLNDFFGHKLPVHCTLHIFRELNQQEVRSYAWNTAILFQESKNIFFLFSQKQHCKFVMVQHQNKMCPISLNSSTRVYIHRAR